MEVNPRACRLCAASAAVLMLAFGTASALVSPAAQTADDEGYFGLAGA